MQSAQLSLLYLPSTIRIRILQTCLLPIQIPSLNSARPHDWFSRFTAITRTCQQLRYEALPIFFEHNTIHFETFVTAVCGNLECSPFVWLIDDVDNKYAISSSLLSLFPISRPMRPHVRHMQLRIDCSAFALGVGNDEHNVPKNVDFLQPLSQLDAWGFTGLKTLRLIACDAMRLEGTAKKYRIHTRDYRESHRLPKGVFKIEFRSARPWSLEGPVRPEATLDETKTAKATNMPYQIEVAEGEDMQYRIETPDMLERASYNGGSGDGLLDLLKAAEARFVWGE